MKKKSKPNNVITLLKVLSLFWTESVKDLLLYFLLIVISIEYLNDFRVLLIIMISLGVFSRYALKILNIKTIDEHESMDR